MCCTPACKASIGVTSPEHTDRYNQDSKPWWARDPGEDEPAVPPEERGAVLVELLELSDALPPLPERELEFPPFRTVLKQ